MLNTGLLQLRCRLGRQRHVPAGMLVNVAQLVVEDAVPAGGAKHLLDLDPVLRPFRDQWIFPANAREREVEAVRARAADAHEGRVHPGERVGLEGAVCAARGLRERLETAVTRLAAATTENP